MPDPTADQPYPVLGRDLAVLIGIVAILEAESALGELPDHLERRLTQRLSVYGEPGAATSAALRGGLAELAQRLHAAYGA